MKPFLSLTLFKQLNKIITKKKVPSKKKPSSKKKLSKLNPINRILNQLNPTKKTWKQHKPNKRTPSKKKSSSKKKLSRTIITGGSLTSHKSINLISITVVIFIYINVLIIF